MNKKISIIVVSTIICISFLLLGTISYYRVVKNGRLNATTGKLVFSLKNNNQELNNKSILLNDGNEINPGDSGSFTIVLDGSNSSVELYSILEIDKGNLPTNLKFYTSDKKSELHKHYSLLEKNSETLTIYWYWDPYKNDSEDNKYINQKNLSATIKASVIQISNYTTMKNGSVMETGTSTLSGTEFWNEAYRPYIKTITFGNDINKLPSNCTEDNLCFDITEQNNTKKVYGYLKEREEKDSNQNVLYDLHIVSEAPIFAPQNSEWLFGGFTSLESIEFNNNFNTSKVVYMNQMFSKDTSLISLDLSTFNTTNVINMSNMFFECKSLTSLNLDNFNTAKLIVMTAMFQYCSSLTSLDLSTFNTSNVNYLNYFVADCSNILELDLSNFNTKNVTTMTAMFIQCRKLQSLNLNGFNTSNVLDMDYMFYTCSSLTTLDLSNFNTQKLTSTQYMFSNCTKLTNIDLRNFNTSKVNNMKYMFSSCSSLVTLDLNSFNTSNVTDMSYMFVGCNNIEKIDFSNMTTTSVTNMNQMFDGCTKISTTINITKSSGIEYTDMFKGAATASSASIKINYIASSSNLVDSMIQTKSSNSKITKGMEL